MVEHVAIAAEALRSIMEDTHEHFIRKVLRWYSRTFNTPLHEVEDLPLEDVLLHWYETQFEELDSDELLDKARLLAESDDERAARVQSERTEDDEWVQQVEGEARPVKKTDKTLVSGEAPKPQALITNEDLAALNEVPEINIRFEPDNLQSE